MMEEILAEGILMLEEIFNFKDNEVGIVIIEKISFLLILDLFLLIKGIFIYN